MIGIIHEYIFRKIIIFAAVTKIWANLNDACELPFRTKHSVYHDSILSPTFIRSNILLIVTCQSRLFIVL